MDFQNIDPKMIQALMQMRGQGGGGGFESSAFQPSASSGDFGGGLGAISGGQGIGGGGGGGGSAGAGAGIMAATLAAKIAAELPAHLQGTERKQKEYESLLAMLGSNRPLYIAPMGTSAFQ